MKRPACRNTPPRSRTQGRKRKNMTILYTSRQDLSIRSANLYTFRRQYSVNKKLYKRLFHFGGCYGIIDVQMIAYICLSDKVLNMGHIMLYTDTVPSSPVDMQTISGGARTAARAEKTGGRPMGSVGRSNTKESIWSWNKNLPF